MVFGEVTVGGSTTRTKYVVDNSGEFPQVLLELDPDNSDSIEKSYVWANDQVMVKYDGWHTGEGSARNASAGLNLRPPGVSVFDFQIVYQIDFLNTGAKNEQNWSVLSQFTIRF